MPATELKRAFVFSAFCAYGPEELGVGAEGSVVENIPRATVSQCTSLLFSEERFWKTFDTLQMTQQSQDSIVSTGLLYNTPSW